MIALNLEAELCALVHNTKPMKFIKSNRKKINKILKQMKYKRKLNFIMFYL